LLKLIPGGVKIMQACAEYIIIIIIIKDIYIAHFRYTPNTLVFG